MPDPIRSLCVLAAWLALGAASGCGGSVDATPAVAPAATVASPVTATAPAPAAPTAPVVPVAPVAPVAPIAPVAPVAPVAPAPVAASVDVTAVAVSAGLAVDAAIDHTTTFTAPGGQSITVLVKGPAGITAQTACPSAQCYVMRALKSGERPDSYFPAAVAAAVAAGAHKLVFPRGVYQFAGPVVSADSSNADGCNETHYYNCTPHWTIGTYATGAGPAVVISDLDIDLSGSTLNFAAPTTGIWVLNAQRLKIENFTIDWPTLKIASLGTIVADPSNPGHQALVLDDAYPAADPLTGGAVRIDAVDPWDDSTDPAIAPGRFDQTATNALETYFIFGNPPQPTYLGKTSAGNQTYSCASCRFVNSATDPTCSMFAGCANFDEFAPGARVIARHYTYNGFALLVNWTSDLDLDNVTLLTSPGMGIAVQNAGGYRGLRVANSHIARAAGRLVSTASDGINVSQFGGDVIIDGNEIAYQGDDGVNVSPLSQTFTINSPGNLAAAGECEPNPRDVAVNGDTLAFFADADTYLGNTMVAFAKAAACNGAMVFTLALECVNSASCTAMVSALDATDSFVDLTQQPVARYVIRNTYFHENRGQGTQTGAPFGAVTGNTFFRNSFGPTSTEGFADLGKSNVSFSGNVLN